MRHRNGCWICHCCICDFSRLKKYMTVGAGKLGLPVLLALVGPSFMSSEAKTWEVTAADFQPTVPSLLSAVVGTSDSSSLNLTSTLYSKVRMIFPPHANLY